jgi:hypothetical protein
MSSGAHEKEMNMDELIAQFLAGGGTVTKLDPGACIGIKKRDWDHAIRGTTPPIVEEIVKQGVKPMTIRPGHGVVA